MTPSVEVTTKHIHPFLF